MESNTNILSWPEARLKLREVLKRFLEDPPPKAAKIHNDRAKQSPTWLLWFVERNLDLYLGSSLIAGGLFVVSCLALVDRGADGDIVNAAASKRVYKFDIAASAILMVFAIVSLWLVKRSTSLRRSDSDIAKKRDVIRFIKTTKQSTLTEEDLAMKMESLPNISGTALSDIYRVYRYLSNGNQAAAHWACIPSLLLVEGDIIALQIGDMIPADSCFVELPSIRLTRGKRLTLDMFGETEADVFAELPVGRTTISSQSEHLLTLCNRIRLVRVLETPLSEFLRRPAVEYKSSQVWRKLQAIRGVFVIISALSLCLSAMVLLVRPDIAKGDLSLVLSLPFVSALGLSPAVAPVFVFFLEVFGTARILATVHPFANRGSEEVDSIHTFPKSRLLFRYFVATTLSRLSLWPIVDSVQRFFPSFRKQSTSRLVRVPPATLNLLEKLGVCTAFALVDDELACESSAIPQQLLIPSRSGLKLLDICPTYDDESTDGSDNDTVVESLNGRKHAGGRPPEDSDSDSETGEGTLRFHSTLRRKFLKPRALKRKRQRRRLISERDEDDSSSGSDDSEFEFQFEDPRWWQHLPSLKCIGLSCMLVDEPMSDGNELNRPQKRYSNSYQPEGFDAARLSLVSVIASEKKRYQLTALAECIGFTKAPNSFGPKGDISCFTEKLRVHILSKALFRERLSMDAHERSSELSRWWGHLHSDCTSVIVKDSRSGGYQLLTVGDPQVVLKLCNEAWQGEISTISPLGSDDRKTILESSKAWKLADLDVAAFSYAPLPLNLEQRLVEGSLRTPVYLLDHTTLQSPPILKDKSVSPEWSLIRNQIFLGMLGSLLIPRREIQSLIDTMNKAGVRFVLFSYRNMRRQKELASQMGIDVAWNCAISLRPLESGEKDPHRMVSNYADWTVNAKLPHGVDDVRKHLEEVDNVPLLVSLYTDVTKHTTKEVVDIFQDYSDTVIAVGLSHMPSNDGIFSTADIAVGIDVFADGKVAPTTSSGALMDAELELVSAISSHACAFRFRGASSVYHLSAVIEEGRASLESATAGIVFFLASSLSLSVYVFLVCCTPMTTIPHVPILGVVVFLLFVIPVIGFSMAFSAAGPNTMKQVPPKNDTKVTFGKKEGVQLYNMLCWKALPPALFCQFLHLISYGELILALEPELVEECGSPDHWYGVIRCSALKKYSGPARISSGIIIFAVFVLTTILLSATYIDRFEPLVECLPWKQNHTWIPTVLATGTATLLITIYSVHEATKSSLPWYFYVLVVIVPFLCAIWNEYCKKLEGRVSARAEKLRRLQFETRLGAWSPK